MKIKELTSQSNLQHHPVNSMENDTDDVLAAKNLSVKNNNISCPLITDKGRCQVAEHLVFLERQEVSRSFTGIQQMQRNKDTVQDKKIFHLHGVTNGKELKR